MKIWVLPRQSFKQLEYHSDVAYISIHDPDFSLIWSDSENVLNLWFHDAEHEMEFRTVLFNEYLAEKIYKFVQHNLDKKLFVIHCTLGKCRSGAVGEVLADYFKIPYFEFKRLNPQVQPNILVKTLLSEKFFGEKFVI